MNVNESRVLINAVHLTLNGMSVPGIGNNEDMSSSINHPIDTNFKVLVQFVWK